MDGEQFYVTLPSNVDDSIHLYNTMANYTTQLFTPLVFSSQYEVALVEVTFPTPSSLTDMPIGKIVLMQYQNKFRQKGKTHPANKSLVEYVVKMSDLKRENFVEYINSNLRVMSEELDCSPPPRFTKIQLEDNYYHKLLPDFEDGHSILMYGEIADLMGFKRSTDNKEYRIGHGNRGDTINYEYSKLSFNANNLFVYTDIINHQYVGNTYTQLLRCVPIDYRIENQSIVYNSPHYVPLNTNYIDSIQITIKDDENQFINFKTGIQKVYVKLHFRPKHGYF